MAAINRTLTLLFLFIMLFKSLDTSAPSVSALYVTMFSITCASAGIMYDPHSRGLTEEISIKQGKLVGVKVEFKSSSHLKPVEMYLGIPYAAAPTGSQRFMPPGSPPQWLDVKYATRHQAVCPQNLPDINEERRKSTMSEGRVNYLKRLLSYLQDNQSEDCLYLNIYAPAQKRGLYKSKAKYPVIVFIHGESFEWNSGNPYDGSVLASYGEVVVVTLNFRLGILGFLRPGVGDNTLTNFGLLDQIAALQWVKENIEHFGGDSKCVTLMGHDTGAACVNYLMVSPVSRGIGGSGLFHRAILMSGTALADWALTTSNIFTIQVAQALNCPLKETNNEMAECLRKRRIDEIMAVKVEAPEFKTRFGPMVDGSVVPNDPVHLTGEYHDLFGRYELLYGVTELESYNLLDAVSLRYGMLEQDRDKKIRAYVQERFQYLPDMYLAETLKAYTDVSRRISDSSSQSIAENNRDTLLDILSDARVVAPMVQTANFHSSANPKSYFYVFSHRNMYGDFATVTIDKSIHGEELPYVFGVPIVKGDFPGNPYSALHEEFPSHSVFTDAERLLSEAVITFWTNFAKTGNPNAPNRQKFLTTTELDWPEYDGINKTFLSLGVPPKIAHHYRQKKMDFWNEHIPEVFKNLPPNESSKNNNPDKPEILPPEPYFPRKPFFPFHPERKPEIITWYNGLPVFSSTPPPRVYGTLVKSGNEKPRSATSGLLGVDGGFGSKFALENSPKTTDSPSEVAAGNSSSMAMSIVIVVGVCLLLVNLCAFAGLYYQRDKLKVREKLMKKRYEDVENVNNEDFYMKKKPEEREDDNIEVIEMTTKKDNRKKKLQQSGDELYEAVRSRGKTHEGNEDKVEGDDGDESGFKRWKLSRQCSSSTMDPHTKVREWIAHEIVQRCSPRFLRKTKNQHQTIRPILQKDSSFDTFIEHDPSAVALEENKHPIPSSPALSKPATTTTLQRAKVKKVSVAVDATPGARGSSVMKQIPVEQMSKSMEELGLGKCISTSEITLQQKRAALKRSETCRESLARSSSSSSDPTNRDTVLRRSTTSISLQLSKPALNAKDNSLTISHQHSKSDPVPNSMQYVVQNSNCPHNSQFVNISLDSKGGVSSPVTAKGGLKKQMKSFQTTGPHSKGKVLKEVPIPTTPVPKSATDVNVTSRDSSDNPEEVQTTDPLKTIQRRNFPKVLPDLPPAQDVSHFEKESKDSEREFTSVQALAAKRRSLPPPIHLMVGLEPPPSEAGSISQPTTPTSPYQKEYFTQTGKVPPPPPPRISSTLGRKPSNTAPVSQLSSSFDSQDSEYIISPAPSPTYHQRQEPRVIIKPTSTAPVSRNPSQQGRDKTHIPRVVPNTGEEYPLTPTAIHHHYHHQHHQTNDVTSPSPSLSRQSSVRCQGPQSPVLPTQQSATVSKTPVKFPHSYQHPTKPINQQTIPTSQTESSQQQPMIHSPSKTITQQQTHKPALQNKADDSMVTPTSQAKSVSQKVPAKKSIEASTSSSLPSEDTSSNTGTVKRVKKGHDPKAKTAGGNQSTSSTSSNKGTTAPKAWYAQYNQSFLSKSKDSDK